MPRIRKESPQAKIGGLEKSFHKAATVEAKEQAIVNLVTFATEENYDCYPILQVLDFAIDLTLKPGEIATYGQQALNLVNNYFTQAGVCFKNLIPLQTPIEKIPEKIQTTKGLCQKTARRTKLLKSTPVPSSLLTLIEGLDHSFRSIPAEPEKRNIMNIIVIRERETGSSYKEYINKQELILETIESQKASFKNFLHTPEVVITLAAQTLGHINFNSVSTQDLAEETNPPDFAKKMLSFIAGAPKGDVFWQRFFQAAFLALPYHNPHSNSYDTFQSPLLSKSVFLAQLTIAEHLILPAFPDSFTHDFTLELEDFDHLLDQALGNLDPYCLRALGSVIATSAIRGPLTKATFDPELLGKARDPDKILDLVVKDCPITLLAIDQLKKITQLQFFDSDSIGEFFLKTNFETITQHLSQRLKIQPRKIKAFLWGLDYITHQDYDQYYRDRFLGEMRTALGTAFMENLNLWQSELAKINQVIWQDIIGLTQQSQTWFDSEIFQRIDFGHDKHSLGALLGISKLEFLFTKSLQEVVSFYIRTSNDGLTFNGLIQADGSLSELSIKGLEEKTPGLTILLQTIVLSSVHDLLKDLIESETLEDWQEARTIIKTKPPGEAIRETAEPTIDADTSKPILEIKSEKLTARIKEHAQRMGFTPRWVSMHTRYVPHGEDYHHAYLEWEKNQEASALGYLRVARRKLGRPSRAKLHNLPPSFQLLSVTDPQTEAEYILQTWVVGYHAPKPASDDPMTIYKTYYQGTSALSFTDYLRIWAIRTASEIVAEEISDES